MFQNIGNTPQTVNNQTVQQRPPLRTIVPTRQVNQINQPRIVTPVVNQGSISHAPDANQLLKLINNPDFLIRLLQSAIPQNSRQKGVKLTEDFIEDIHDIKELSERTINNSLIDNYDDNFNEYDEYQEDLETYDYIDENNCECTH